ncbi:hypothetical protein [Pseudomonas nitroreducens]|uniref:hypothetical protein n=1 Tax=Pseudomonas nitroreducens TaxID=46680 RepID=UPI001FB74352|nr:hypothetical protein [Pseudomonas nitroreducens]MCJ1883020.1 hypothetical protein [Pseudomonas nitroreducens]MCJ1897160.1 hypothetical protein [Pseudomonas nitroreducens]
MRDYSNSISAKFDPSELDIYFWTFRPDELVEARFLERELIENLRPLHNKIVPRLRVSTVGQKEKISRFSAVVAAASSFAAIGALVVTVQPFFSGKGSYEKDKVDDASGFLIVAVGEQKKIKADLDSLRSDLNVLRKSLEGSDRVDALMVSNKLAERDHEVKVLSDKVLALEAALNSDPAKALAVPILRKDLDNAREGFKNSTEQTKLEIDRIYDQNKWFIGLMFTVSLSVLGMAASIIFTGRKESSPAVSD